MTNHINNFIYVCNDRLLRCFTVSNQPNRPQHWLYPQKTKQNKNKKQQQTTTTMTTNQQKTVHSKSVTLLISSRWHYQSSWNPCQMCWKADPPWHQCQKPGCWQCSVVSVLCWWSSESSCHGFDSQSRKGERLFSVLTRQYLCRIVGACLTFVCTARTKIVVQIKDPMATFQQNNA